MTDHVAAFFERTPAPCCQDDDLNVQCVCLPPERVLRAYKDSVAMPPMPELVRTWCIALLVDSGTQPDIRVARSYTEKALAEAVVSYWSRVACRGTWAV